LTCEPNPNAAEDFKKVLLKEYKNYVKAWRVLLDRDGSNSVAWEEFEAAAKQINYVGDLAGAWRSFDEDISGTVSLREIDGPSFELLNGFKTWAESEFGSVKSTFLMLDADNSGDFDKREWAKSLVYFGFQGDCRALFKVLDTDGEGLVSIDEVAFLDQWEDAEEEELPVEPDAQNVHAGGPKPKKTKKGFMLSPRLEKLAASKPKPAVPLFPALQDVVLEQPSKPDMMRSTYGRLPKVGSQRPAATELSIPGAMPTYVRKMRVEELKEDILTNQIDELPHTDKFGWNLADIKRKTHSLRSRTVELFGKDEVFEGSLSAQKKKSFALPKVQMRRI